MHRCKAHQHRRVQKAMRNELRHTNMETRLCHASPSAFQFAIEVARSRSHSLSLSLGLFLSFFHIYIYIFFFLLSFFVSLSLSLFLSVFSPCSVSLCLVISIFLPLALGGPPTAFLPALFPAVSALQLRAASWHQHQTTPGLPGLIGLRGLGFRGPVSPANSGGGGFTCLSSTMNCGSVLWVGL